MKKIYLIIIFLFSFTLIIGNNEEWVSYSNLFSLIFIGFSALQIKSLPRIDGFIRSFIWFMMFCFLSIFWSISIEDSFKTLQTLFTIFVLLILLSYVFQEGKYRRAFLLGIFFGLLINYLELLSIINLPIAKYENYRFMGTLGKSNILAIVSVFYLIMLFSYFATNRIKGKLDTIWVISSLLICSQLCLATGSRKGLIGYVIIALLFIFLLFKERDNLGFRNLMPLNFLLLFIVVFFTYSSFVNSESFEMSYNRFLGLGIGNETEDGSTIERKRLLGKAMELFYSSPFFGNGINSFRSTSWAYSHSNIGEILSGIGIIGALLFYSIHFQIFSLLKRSSIFLMLGGMITLLLIIMFEFSMVSYYDKFFYFSFYFIYSEIYYLNLKKA